MQDFELLNESYNVFNAVTCICEFNSPDELVKDFNFLHECIGRFEESYERILDQAFTTLGQAPTVTIDLFDDAIIGDPLGSLFEVGLQVEDRFYYSIVRHFNLEVCRSSVHLFDPAREALPITEDPAKLKQSYDELRQAVKAFESSNDAKRLMHSVQKQCSLIYSQLLASQPTKRGKPGPEPTPWAKYKSKLKTIRKEAWELWIKSDCPSPRADEAESIRTRLKLDKDTFDDHIRVVYKQLMGTSYKVHLSNDGQLLAQEIKKADKLQSRTRRTTRSGKE